MLKSHEQILWELKQITLLPESKIEEFVSQSAIGYDDLKYWYLATGKMPDKLDQLIIYRFGVELAVSDWRNKQPKINLDPKKRIVKSGLDVQRIAKCPNLI